MTRSLSATALGLAVLGLFVILPSAAPGQRGELVPLVIQSDRGTHQFQVEVARTPEEQARGLMFRRRLGALSGMLFPLETPRVMTMWMKNTFIPLDMLFIGIDGRIVRIAARTVPRSEALISSGVAVIGVLELNGGSASRLGIREGDRVLSKALGAPLSAPR